MAKDPVVDLLVDLIRIPSFVTTQPGENENKVVDFIEAWLMRNTNLQVSRQKLPGGRYNLIARLGKPETIYLGHTDTVLPNSNARVNQLKGELIKGEIWGRGATDMKSGVASLMSAASLAKNSNNYWMFFYADEEYDFLGMKGLVKKFGKLRPRRLISADGSDLEMGHGCRGLVELTYRVRGETGHPAKGTGNNAIWGTNLMLVKLKKFLETFSHPVMGGTSFNLAYIHGGAELASTLDKNDRLKEVGKAGNVVADICEFTIDIRPAKPDLNAERIMKFVEREITKLGLKTELVEKKHDLGAWYTDKKVLAKVGTISKKVIGSVNYANPRSTGYLDLQMFWEATGRPVSFMLGGGIGSTAHKPDERIKIKDLIKERDFFRAVMEDFG